MTCDSRPFCEIRSEALEEVTDKNTLLVYGTLDMDAIYKSRRLRYGNKLHKGAKPIYGKPMQQYGLFLDSDTVRLARKLGRGNLSHGIRLGIRRTNGE